MKSGGKRSLFLFTALFSSLELLNLPHRTMKPPPADHRAAHLHERLVDVGTLVEPRPQPAELVQQRDRLLHHVAEDPQPAAVRLAAAGQARGDPAARQRHPVRVRIVRPVAHDLLGLLQRGTDLAPDRRDGVHQRDQLRHIVAIGGRQNARQRRSLGVDGQVVLAPVLAAVHGAGARFFPPCTARTDAESTTTRQKSIASSPRSLSSSRRWSWSHTPALRHSSRRFHRVMPQQPISWGKSSQGMPVLSTKRIPVRQTRSGTRGLPTPGTYGCFGRIGSTKAQSSSGTNNLPIASSMTTTVETM